MDRRRPGLLAAVGAIAASAIVGGASALLAPPASAHGEDAIVSVETAEPSGTSVHYVVKMVYENDGEPVSGKVVTATPTGPDGVARAAVTLTPLEEGRYEGTLEMPEPGSWTVTFASADPEGSLAHTEVRPEPPPSTTTTTTTSAPSEPDDESASAADESAAAAPADDEDDDGGSGGAAVVAAVVLAAAVITTVMVVRRRRSASTA